MTTKIRLCIFKDCGDIATKRVYFDSINSYVYVCDYHSDVSSDTELSLVAKNDS